LYGGQQFERLFTEFRAVMKNIEIDKRELGSITGPEDKKYLQLAVELVQMKSEAMLIPLIEQLVQRAAYIMKRIPRIIENIIQDKQQLPDQTSKILADYHFFAPFNTHLKDQFDSYVDKIESSSKNICMEEFCSAKTLLWYFMNEEDGFSENINPNPAELVTQIFDIIKKRIAKNTLRKLYNFFLLPFMQADIWTAIQTYIFRLDSVALEEIFEFQHIEEEIDNDLEKLDRTLEQIQEQDSALHEIMSHI